jgi:hypothetical protein
MPGVQKGKPHKPGAGRPRLSPSPTVRLTVTLPTELAAQLRALGQGNASAGVRRLLARHTSSSRS